MGSSKDVFVYPIYFMTHLEIANRSLHAVNAYLTLGTTPGCVQDVGLLTLSDGLKFSYLLPYMCVVHLPSKASTRVIVPEGLGLNGNLCFGTWPLNCPTPDLPEGVCLAEFIINNGGCQPDGQETVDISCVCGANAFLAFELSAGDWTSNGGAIPVQIIANTTRFQNTGLVGVYPYGCDNCTSSDNPPDCVGQQPDQVNALPICNVQRPALGNDGGVVRVVFRGFTPVPL
jgi:hypothetical protein